MNLYEIITAEIGESYVRCYAWARDAEHAKEMFHKRNKNVTAVEINPLLPDNREPFITSLSGCGWGVPKMESEL